MTTKIIFDMSPDFEVSMKVYVEKLVKEVITTQFHKMIKEYIDNAFQVTIKRHIDKIETLSTEATNRINNEFNEKYITECLDNVISDYIDKEFAKLHRNYIMNKVIENINEKIHDESDKISKKYLTTIVESILNSQNISATISF